MTAPGAACEPLGPLLRLPCLVTLAGGGAGVLGVVAFADGQTGLGVLGLVLGQLLDGLDGFLARRLRLCSAVGAELDLSVDIGLVHALLVVWGLVFLLPVVAGVQAVARVRRRRFSGRTIAVVLTLLALL